jgi:hypothetical protein
VAEQHDKWAVARRSMSAESLAKTRIRVIDGAGEAVREEAKQLARPAAPDNQEDADILVHQRTGRGPSQTRLEPRAPSPMGRPTRRPSPQASSLHGGGRARQRWGLTGR